MRATVVIASAGRCIQISLGTTLQMRRAQNDQSRHHPSQLDLKSTAESRTYNKIVEIQARSSPLVLV